MAIIASSVVFSKQFFFAFSTVVLVFLSSKEKNLFFHPLFVVLFYFRQLQYVITCPKDEIIQFCQSGRKVSGTVDT